MVSAVIDGRPLAPDMVKWCKRVTHGNVTMVLAGPQSMLDATFTLDPSHSPRHIDYVNRSGKNKGKAQAGIYEIEGEHAADLRGRRPAARGRRTSRRRRATDGRTPSGESEGVIPSGDTVIRAADTVIPSGRYRHPERQRGICI